MRLQSHLLELARLHLRRSPLMDTFAQRNIVTSDGHPLVARFFDPVGARRASALIVPAMGVAQPYYAPFAAWLAAQGVLTATFDFRGIGLSRRGSLRRLEADVLTWARLDVAAVLDSLTAAGGGEPLVWIGHSLGGQIIPFVPNAARAAKILTVAAGSGYWRENAAPIRPFVRLLWFVAVPVLVPLFGYFPGKRLGMVGDLPRGVIRQWRRWCLHPEYAAGVERAHPQYAAVRMPIVSLSFTDDEFMSARNIEALHGLYVNAPRTMRRVAPQDIGVERIGHFGFFRPQFQDSLWKRYVLPALAPAPAAGRTHGEAPLHGERRQGS